MLGCVLKGCSAPGRVWDMLSALRAVPAHGWMDRFLSKVGEQVRAPLLEDRLGSTWAEFQSTPSHFNAVNADDIVRRYDEWRGTEAARIYVLERCEDHGLD